MKKILLFLFLIAGWELSAQTDLLPGGVKGRDAGSDSTFLNVNGSAVGKRPGDNVYKNGTIGVGTTDTTAVINLQTFGTSEKPGVVINGSTNTGIFYQKNRALGYSGLSNFGSFNLVGSYSAGANLPYTAYPNYVWGMGYNYATTTAREKLNQPAFGMTFETYFQNASLGAGSTGFLEFHLKNTDTLLGVEHRSISGVFPWRYARGLSDIGFNVDNLYFNEDYGGGTVWKWSPLANNWTISDTTNIVFSDRRGFSISALNGAGNSFMKLFSFENEDTLSTCYTCPGIKFYGTTVFQNDHIYPSVASGTLEVGTFGGRTARLKINGLNSVPFEMNFGSTSYGFELFGGNLAVTNRSTGANPFYIFSDVGTAGIIARANNLGVGQVPGNFPEARIHAYNSAGIGSKLLAIENSTGRNIFYRSNLVPTSQINANPGDIVLFSDGTNGGLYGKYSGTGSATGWGKFLNLIDPNGASSNQVLTWNGSSWAPATNTSESTKIGTFSTATDPKGLTISGDSIKLMSASLTRPGGINLIAQAFQAGAGAKLFQSTGTASIAIDNAADTGEAGINFTQLSGADIMAQMSVNSTDASNARLQLLIEDDGAYVNYLNIGTENDEKGVFQSGGMYEDAPKNVTSTTYTLQYGDRNLLLNATNMVLTLQEIGTGPGQTKPGRVVWFFNDDTTAVTLTGGGGQNIVDANTLSLSGNTGISLIAAPTGKWVIKG